MVLDNLDIRNVLICLIVSTPHIFEKGIQLAEIRDFKHSTTKFIIRIIAFTINLFIYTSFQTGLKKHTNYLCIKRRNTDTKVP